MKKPADPHTVELRVVSLYHKLYADLTEFADAVQEMENGAIVLEDIVVNHKPEGGIRLEYKSSPVRLTINSRDKQFTLTVNPKKN